MYLQARVFFETVSIWQRMAVTGKKLLLDLLRALVKSVGEHPWPRPQAG
jgi:hypothetical protein